LVRISPGTRQERVGPDNFGKGGGDKYKNWTSPNQTRKQKFADVSRHEKEKGEGVATIRVLVNSSKKGGGVGKAVRWGGIQGMRNCNGAEKRGVILKGSKGPRKEKGVSGRTLGDLLDW